MSRTDDIVNQVGLANRKDPKAWAKRIIQRDRQGDRTVNAYALELARKALRDDVEEPAPDA